MVIRELEELLKSTMGLDAASIGSAAIGRAVDERMAACTLFESRAYYERVRTHETELQALIEAVVVPETWFFRNPEAFSELVRTIALGALRPAGDRLRLLSVPCSSGEEPYTIAMALLDARISRDRFSIDAIDISAPLLALAKLGLYGSNSFRGGEHAFRERYFETTPDGYLIRNEIRASVTFARQNIFGPDILTGRGRYDAIFCRNLLVYFDRATQDRAISILRGLLAPNGTIFVGSSEAGLMFANGFVWSKVPLSFSFSPGKAVGASPACSVAPALPTGDARSAPAPAPAPAPVPAPAPAPQAFDAAASLREVGRLADGGDLAEASVACADHVRTFGPSARAFHLSGSICNAAGNSREAIDDLRKAVYLEPENADALAYLAALLDRRGDENAARMLRDRVERLRRGRRVSV